MKKAYYARPISIDDTPQMERDFATIRALGFEPYPIGDEKAAILEQYKKIGMDAFRPAVEASDAIFYRSFPDGSIGAGVKKELDWAIEKGLPVMEFARQIERRSISVDDTRAMLTELGYR